jgi:hypothetical protein
MSMQGRIEKNVEKLRSYAINKQKSTPAPGKPVDRVLFEKQLIKFDVKSPVASRLPASSQERVDAPINRR